MEANLQEILDAFLKFVLIPLIGLGGAWLVKFIQAKSEEINATKLFNENEKLRQYKDMLIEDLCSAVAATNQVFTDVLKASGEWSKENWEEAFNRTKELAISMFNEDAKNAVATAVGDFEVWLQAKIEEIVGVAREIKKEAIIA